MFGINFYFDFNKHMFTNFIKGNILLLFITFYLFRNIPVMSDNPYLIYQMRNSSRKHKTTLILRSLSILSVQWF